MGYAAKSSEFSIEPFRHSILESGRGVDRLRDWILFRKLVPINGYQVMVFPGRGMLHDYCIHTVWKMISWCFFHKTIDHHDLSGNRKPDAIP